MSFSRGSLKGSLEVSVPCAALPDSQCYGDSASSRIGRWTTHPATPQHRLHHGRGRSENLPVFTRCSLTEGGTRLSACGTHRRLLRSHSPPAPPGESNSSPGRSVCPSLRQTAHAPAPDPQGWRRLYVKTGDDTGSSRIPLQHRSPRPRHPAVLTRHGFVRAAPTLPGVSPVRLPPAS